MEFHNVFPSLKYQARSFPLENCSAFNRWFIRRIRSSLLTDHRRFDPTVFFFHFQNCTRRLTKLYDIATTDTRKLSNSECSARWTMFYDNDIEINGLCGETDDFCSTSIDTTVSSWIHEIRIPLVSSYIRDRIYAFALLSVPFANIAG